ncbi:MAG TPA: DNA repair protein RadC [Bacteroidota bacterium]|nr:DNA repair protein RadC [Bacteroidota bacterium]
MRGRPAAEEPARPARRWPAGERPREKLLEHGARTLSDAELLAVMLMTGARHRSAMEIACGLLERGLPALARRNAAELMRVAGVGSARAMGILAAFELGRRLQADTGGGRSAIRTPADAARLVIPRMRDLTHEVFAVLVLDAAAGVIAIEELSRGTLNASIVHPREVFKAAVDHLGASVLVAHNHPSGNPEPSGEDLAITRQLADAGKILGIPLHDHLIVAGNAYVSLAERGHLY